MHYTQFVWVVDFGSDQLLRLLAGWGPCRIGGLFGPIMLFISYTSTSEIQDNAEKYTVVRIVSDTNYVVVKNIASRASLQDPSPRDLELEGSRT